MCSLGRTVKRWSIILGINGAAVLALIFAFFAATENYIKARRRTTLVYESHPLHRQQFVPNQAIDIPGAHIEIGSHSLRGAEPPMPKPKDELRIFVMGGSSVFDIFSDSSWPESLSQYVQTSTRGRAASYNGGVPGNTSRESLALYKDNVRFFDPDVVLIYQSWNDAKYMRAFQDGVDVDDFFALHEDPADSYRFLTDPRPLRNWHALQRRLQDLRTGGRMQEGLRRSREIDAEIGHVHLNDDWARTPGMDYWRRNIRDFVQTIRADGAQPVLVLQTTLVTADLDPKLRSLVRYDFVDLGHEDIVQITEIMTTVLREVAAKEGVPVIDVRDVMNSRPDYFADHVHLKPEGSAALARAVGEALNAVLTGR